MKATNIRVCYRCRQPDGCGPRELRPYGPGGSLVCAECALGSESGRKEAERQFAKLLDAIEGPVVLTRDGPKRYPGGGTS